MNDHWGNQALGVKDQMRETIQNSRERVHTNTKGITLGQRITKDDLLQKYVSWLKCQ